MTTLLIAAEQAPRRAYLAALLQRQGYQVGTADDGDQALDAVRSSRPDLLLIDILMPPPGGYQIVRQLRALPVRPLPRIVFLAAPYMEGEARLLAEACGITHVVADIADSAALLANVAAALAETPPRNTPVVAAAKDHNPLSPMLGRLYGRVAELETFGARLERSAAVGAAQLQVARSALDREVIKRLWAERGMTQEYRRLRDEAVRDPVTGLYNRRYLEESLAREEARARRSGRPLGMMMIDIDHLTPGDAANDTALCAVARCMESLARSEDILCRYDGTKFVLVMANTAQTALRQRAAAMLAGVPKLHIEHDGHPLGPLTLSIGIALFPDHGGCADAVLRAADSALDHARSEGIDHVAVSDAGAQEASA